MKYFIFESKSKTRDQMLKDIAEFALKKGISNSAKSLHSAFLKREKEGTTGFEDGIAIPHARISDIKENAIIIARNKNGVDWSSLDGKKVTTAVSINIAKNISEGDAHMEALSKVATDLMDIKKRNIYKSGTITEIKNMLNSDEKITSTKKKYYDIVAISTCPTGVAHTNMAAEAMTIEAKKQKLSIKVERQAAEGIVDGLTPEDIKSAKLVILAAGKQVDGTERFIGKKVYKVGVVEPIKSSKKVFKEAKAKAKIYKPSRKDTAKQAMSIGGGAKPTQALMNGVSYMIPFVVVGGILIALSLGIGGHKVAGKGLQVEPHSFWDALIGVGGIGFKLMIPILGGFIASAIGGRSAIAPAMIVSYLVGNQDGELWNYSSMQFGGFSDSAKLGFLGSIATGFFVGYIVKLWRSTISIKMPKILKTVEPIIFIPLTITFVSWISFSFIGYLPLFYISKGLNDGVTYLINNNLFFIAALILGAMIAFDMGGPINKIAFLIGGGFISQGKPEVMGSIAAAIAVPPLGTGLGIFIGKYIFKVKTFDKQDQGNAISAIFMSLVGITEGAIPFAVKYPKQVIISNVIGGSIGAAVASLFKITDNAQHGGPIVYILGAIGKNGTTNYVYGLLFLISILIGALITATSMSLLCKLNDNKIKKTTR